MNNERVKQKQVRFTTAHHPNGQKSVCLDAYWTYLMTVMSTRGIASPESMPVIAAFKPIIFDSIFDSSIILHTSSWLIEEAFSVEIRNVQF